MQELERVLREHAERYPKMQPIDAVKLIYQNEFGGGHFIRDEQTCINYLRKEYGSVKKNASVPRYEEIGNGIVRVYLESVKEENLEQLGQDFIRSSAEHKGNLDSFLAKLTVLEILTKEGIFSFGIRDLNAYLAEYKNAGYPMVSHSCEYRESYMPAYRIIHKSYLLNCCWSIHSATNG